MRAKAAFLLVGVLLLWKPAGAPGDAPPALGRRIELLLEKPAAQRAAWGLYAVSLADGRELLNVNAENLFTPASNAKLFSTALALTRLGPQYRFITAVASQASVGAGGALEGDLTLLGGGDPNLSSRVVPYNSRREFDANRLAPLEELVRQSVEAGLRRVEGDIVGDDRRWVRSPYPPGWSYEDVSWGYGAPVSALSLNDNRLEIMAFPGAAVGRPARLRLRPEVTYYGIENRTRTAGSRLVQQRLSMQLDPRRRALVFWGEISARSPGRVISAAIDDPALFAALAFRRELEKLGVEVAGEVRAEHAQPYEYRDLRRQSRLPEQTFALTLATRLSPPLGEMLPIINKESQNLHAEMLLRETAYVTRNIGSEEAAAEELRDFLREVGLSPWEFSLEDGSGLSRKNLVSPKATVKLLEHMWRSAQRDAYLDSLAVAGEDGTLDWRFSDSVARGRVKAKTGTLSGATALAGYAEPLTGGPVAFALFANNYGVSASYIRNIVDQIVTELVTTPLAPGLTEAAAGS